MYTDGPIVDVVLRNVYNYDEWLEGLQFEACRMGIWEDIDPRVSRESNANHLYFLAPMDREPYEAALKHLKSSTQSSPIATVYPDQLDEKATYIYENAKRNYVNIWTWLNIHVDAKILRNTKASCNKENNHTLAHFLKVIHQTYSSWKSDYY